MKSKKIIRNIILAVLTILLMLFLTSLYTTILDNNDYENNYDDNGVYYHNYDFDKLVFDGDKLSYEDDNYYSALGIDISSFQNGLDYETLKKEGVEFVYIRAGYRGNTSGDLFEDALLKKHYREAKEAGLKIGFYFFTQAITTKEATEEAQFFMDITKDFEADLPYVLDSEKSGNIFARTSLLLPFERRNNTRTFLNELINQNKEVMLYSNLAFIKDVYNEKELANYKLWYAQYSLKPSFLYPFEIWQYTETGEINGYDGYLDLNIMFIPKNSQMNAQQ